jgi:hypothetical protein
MVRTPWYQLWLTHQKETVRRSIANARAGVSQSHFTLGPARSSL